MQSVGASIYRSFSSRRKCERFHRTEVSLTGIGAIIQKIKKATHLPDNNGMFEGGQGWNVSAVICGDNSSGFQKVLYYGSGQATVLLEDSVV